jgi:hypothetical protein
MPDKSNLGNMSMQTSTKQSTSQISTSPAAASLHYRTGGASLAHGQQAHTGQQQPQQQQSQQQLNEYAYAAAAAAAAGYPPFNTAAHNTQPINSAAASQDAAAVAAAAAMFSPFANGVNLDPRQFGSNPAAAAALAAAAYAASCGDPLAANMLISYSAYGNGSNPPSAAVPNPPPAAGVGYPPPNSAMLSMMGIGGGSNGLVGGPGGSGTVVGQENGPRRKNATRETTATLKAWLYEHRKNPYPTKAEKIMLAIMTKMSLNQVSTWFANARRRLKKENKISYSNR